MKERLGLYGSYDNGHKVLFELFSTVEMTQTQTLALMLQKCISGLDLMGYFDIYRNCGVHLITCNPGHKCKWKT